MNTYPRDITTQATQLIERYPDLFSASVAKNTKLLAPMLKTRSGAKQALEKERDVLAAAIAQIISGQKTEIRAGQKKLRRKAKRRRFRRC